MAIFGATILAGTAQAEDHAALPANDWSRVALPSPGSAQSIGGFAHGCISGAVPLPVDGVGYEAIRLSRHRYFGHPDLVDFIEGLGRRANAAGLPVFYIGDMGQPRGGPLPYGHASHQTGLDVDIWFTLDTKPNLKPEQREDPPLPSMIAGSGTDWRVDPKRFGPRQVALLRAALADLRVERMFVNPVIKLALCRNYAGAAASGTGWLHRLSPWWGHDDHFHVRLRCPPDSPECEKQPPVPDGDGCDAGLERWARHPQLPPGGGGMPHPHLPARCEDVLAEP